MRLLLASRECTVQVITEHFSQIPKKKKTNKLLKQSRMGFGCPTLLADDGCFGQACTLFYFYSCLFCKFKLIKGANKVVVVVVVGLISVLLSLSQITSFSVCSY